MKKTIYRIIRKVYYKPKCLLIYLVNLGLFNFMPDVPFLKLMYRIRLGKKLDLNNPKTYNAKLQWLKLYNNKPEYSILVDKYEAKNKAVQICKREGIHLNIISTLGVWKSFDDIDFDKLPDKFVLKCTHDSGGLVICTNKKLLDINATKIKINKALKRNFYRIWREYVYKDVSKRIIAEEYMVDNNSTSLRDYKFFCFDGIPKFLYVSDNITDHDNAGMNFYDMDFNPMPFTRKDYPPIKNKVTKPTSFEEMKIIASVLSKGMSHVRVDLYEINKKIYFGEMTFITNAGYIEFVPEEWDEIIGDYLKLTV